MELEQIKNMVASIVRAAKFATGDTTFSFDATDWQVVDIRTLIDEARVEAGANLLKLKGVRVASNVFLRLVGPLAGTQWHAVNAFCQEGVPLVQTADFGTIELVFTR